MTKIKIALCALALAALPSQAGAQSASWLYFKLSGGCPALKYGVVDYSSDCLPKMTYAESVDGYFSITFFTDGGGTVVFSGREMEPENLDGNSTGIIQNVQVIKLDASGERIDIMPSHDQIYGICQSGNIFGNSARIVCRATFKNTGQDTKINGEFVTDGQKPIVSRTDPAQPSGG